ncbi:MAG TPA: HEAT repeat domain-containing protein [Gaiellaceae bacterium]|nr:HEAT repeat domain-containing protein [Gaiellaceae bacterium]
MSVWTSPYVLVLGALVLLWSGVSAYVLVTRALYDFRHLSFNGVRRVVHGWLARAATPEERTAILRRLPRRTLAGIAADSRIEPEIASAAARALLERRWDRLLQRALRHRNEAEKWSRVGALRTFALAGWAIRWSLLERALQDEDEDVVAAAVSLLGSLPDERATRLLVDALVEERYSRSRIATQLERRDAVAALLPLVDDPDDELRYWAATLLPVAASPAVEVAVASLAGDRSPQVRAAAAKAFAAAGGPRAAAIGLDLIGDPVFYVRAQAARAIAAGGRPELAARLVPLMRDPQWWVRTAAKEALAGLGPAVVPTVIDVLHDDDAFARNGAAEVLVEVGAVRRWAAESVDEDDDGAVSRLLADALAAGGEPVRRAVAATVGEEARAKIERLLAPRPTARIA